MEHPTSEWKVDEPAAGEWVIVLFCGQTAYPQLVKWCDYYRDKFGIPLMHAVLTLPVDVRE